MYGNSGFEANPEGLIQKGNDVVKIYSDYSAERSVIDSTVNRVEEAWTGSDSEGYVSQIHSYDEDFKLLGETINRIGEILGTHGQSLVDRRDAVRAAASRL